MPKAKTKVSDIRPAAEPKAPAPFPPPGSNPIMPDAEGFLTLHCPACEEEMRFRPARVAVNAMLAALPADPPLTSDQQYKAKLADYKSRTEKLNAIFSFFEDGHHLQMFDAFQLIMDRDHGCTTPVEEFITPHLSLRPRGRGRPWAHRGRYRVGYGRTQREP
jgi:hypothetical protein